MPRKSTTTSKFQIWQDKRLVGCIDAVDLESAIRFAKRNFGEDVFVCMQPFMKGY